MLLVLWGDSKLRWREAVVGSHEAEAGYFYAAINSEVYRSDNVGRSWHALPIHWPEGFATYGIHAIAISCG